MKKKVRALKAAGQTLRYLARIDPSAVGRKGQMVAAVGPVGVAADHPATRLFEAAANDPGRYEEAWDSLKYLPDVHRRIIAASLFEVAENSY